MDDAVQTVLAQCELWTDNEEYGAPEHNVVEFSEQAPRDLEKAAEETVSYDSQN
jgi:type I restriction enzyme R subunit